MPTIIGHYRLLERIASGGMAEVFLGVDLRATDDKPIVIKRILPHLADDETFVQMFHQETKIAMAVNHPNVVDIIEDGEHRGLPFLAMEYIHGLTWREVMKRTEGRLSRGFVVDLLIQAARGAHAVHETIVDGHQEIVHRDLCPHNLMVDVHGVVKLLDFGIAKAAQGMDTTRTGALKGKTAYLAPEQIQRNQVSRATDVYSLSVVAWELLAGKRMFGEHLGDFEMMQAVVTGKLPSLGESGSDVPLLLAEVVHKGLALDPSHRYESADAFGDAIEEAAAAAGIRRFAGTARDWVRGELGIDLDADLDSNADFIDDLVTHSDADDEPGPTPTQPVSRERTPVFKAKTNRRPVWPWIVIATAAPLLFAAGIALSILSMPTPPEDAPPVTITWAPVMPPAEMVAELEPLRSDLAKALGRPVDFQVAPTYEAAGRILRDGETDFAVLPPLLYLTTKENIGEDLKVAAVTEHDKGTGVDGVLIGGQNFQWTGDAESLKGTTVCFTDPTSTTGHALPRQWMLKHGINPEKDLAKIVFSGNHHQVIEDVATGKCEAGATFSAALRSAVDVGVPVQHTRQLTITGRTPNDAVCAGPNTDAELFQRVQAYLVAWDPEKLHKKAYIGERQHLTGFGIGNDADYNELRSAIAGQ